VNLAWSAAEGFSAPATAKAESKNRVTREKRIVLFI
jgi:hypothetical protein